MRLLRSRILLALLLASSVFAGTPAPELSAGPGFGKDCNPVVLRATRFEKYGPRYIFRSDPSTPGKMKISERGRLKIMSYNMENLVEAPGEYVLDAKGGPVFENGQPKYRYGKLAKTEEAIAGLLRNIESEDPDVIIGIEVGSLHAMQTAFGDRYFMFMIPGNSNRGINIGFMVKKEIDTDIEVQSHRFMRHDYLGYDEEVFQRDFPVLIFRDPGAAPDSKPVLILGAAHHKSRMGHVFNDPKPESVASSATAPKLTPEQISIRDHARARAKDLQAKDPNSSKKRMAQTSIMMQILDEYDADYGGRVPIYMGGDFNSPVVGSTEFQQLGPAGYIDSFQSERVKVDLNNIELTATHSYFPGAYGKAKAIEETKAALADQAKQREQALAKGVDPGEPKITEKDLSAIENRSLRRPSYNRIDAFFARGRVSEDRIIDAHVVPEIGPDGKPLPRPKTLEERRTRASDHRAITMTLDFSGH